MARELTNRKLLDEARQTHAVLLRLEGLTYREIGRRLGVCDTAARSAALLGAARLARAARRARWRWLPSDRACACCGAEEAEEYLRGLGE